jgi:hypothetical protein
VFSFRSATSCALALALASSGCSFCFVTPPPAQYKQAVARPEADCSTSVAAPVIDGVIAGYQVFRTGYALQASDRDYNDVPISRGADIAIGLGMTALFLASTIYGGVNVSACKRLKNGPPGAEFDRDNSNGWRLDKDKEAPEPWQSPAPASRPNPAPVAPPAAPAPSEAAAPAPAAPGPAETAPAAPSATAPSPAAPPPAAPAPSTPPQSAFPDTP